MNKIFKVVWSQVKGCFVVINEFGKTHQSKSKRIAKKGLYRGVLGACILGIISSSPVFAVTGGNETIKFQDGEGTVVGNATAQGNSNTVAIGKESTAKGGSSVAIGGGKTDGKGASDEDQGTGQGQVAIGWSTAVNGTGVVAIGNSGASGRGAVALGNKSSASEEGSVAIGNHSTALGTNSVAIGGGSANGVGAISIGADSSSTYNGAITLGRNSEATNQDAIALGAGSAVGSVGGFAVSGGYVGTSDYYGIAIGAGASVDGGHNNIGGGIALGKDAKVTAEGSVALGYGSEAGAANQNETAKSWEITIGNEKTTYSFAGYYKQQQYVIGNGVVSVGAKGAERMITNVAAGNLSPESTDVVNGSQLYAVTDAVKKIGKVAGAKTTLTETSDGAITVSKSTEDGHDNYDITFNADKVAEATNLSYKASGDTASKTVSLSKGLTFAAGTNLTATSGADGVITYDLKKTLTGITSISNGSNGATITLSDDAVTLNNKPLKGVATGTDATDAVNKRQLDSAIETITGNNGALSNTIT
ncbi:ESPR-type extended signal peptide-containing protein, partial [Veillonella magna]|uniref:ESPR-type extended signal peptide-containing protein n=1 Tax=Veillonella magna TaxID=464322 RepID=UPI00047F9949